MKELQEGNSPFKTKSTYDNKLKVWSGGEKRSLFSPNLSIGEIIYRQMEQHPKLLAQVCITFSKYIKLIWAVSIDLTYGGHCTAIKTG